MNIPTVKGNTVYTVSLCLYVADPATFLHLSTVVNNVGILWFFAFKVRKSMYFMVSCRTADSITRKGLNV